MKNPRKWTIMPVCLPILFLFFIQPAMAKLEKSQVREIYSIMNRNDLDRMESLLNQGMDVNADMGGGVVLVMKAANIGKPGMVKLLIKKGADINRKTNSGDNALMSALSNSKHGIEIAEILLSAGADVRVTNARNGYNPVWKALPRIKTGKANDPGFQLMENILSKGADVDAPFLTQNKTLSGMTPLFSAAKRGHLDVVKLFLNYGADKTKTTADGKTAADFARKSRHPEIAKLIDAWNPSAEVKLAYSETKSNKTGRLDTAVLYEKCKDEIRAPWCFQEAVEKSGTPEMCEEILKYWPTANGVHGWCYYRFAIKRQDCSLCEPIRKRDIHRTCKKDACR